MEGELTAKIVRRLKTINELLEAKNEILKDLKDEILGICHVDEIEKRS